jgi:LPXTG-motif cell wall-anchored protein
MKKSRKILFLTTLVLSLFVFASVAMAWTWTPSDPGYDFSYATSGRGIVPVYVEGNTPGSQTGYSSFKRDLNDDADFMFAGDGPTVYTFQLNAVEPYQVLKVTLVKSGGAIIIDRWEAENIVIDAFLSKGGTNFFAYIYTGTGFMWDTGLYSPKMSGNNTDLSHFTIFYKPSTPNETDPTTSETDPTTTDTDPTTTDTDPTTTDTDPTLTDPSTPLVSTGTIETNPTLTDPDIPQTGESGNNNGVLIGVILLALAGSLALVFRRRQAVN